MIRQDKLKAKKDGKSWQIDSDDLPLSEAQRRQLGEKLEAARELVSAALAPVEKAVSSGLEAAATDSYSVRKLQAFEIGRELYHELMATLGDRDPACTALFDALVQLTQGCHAFRPDEKAKCFDEARRLAAVATAHLLLAQDGRGEPLGARLEKELIPKIGGLVASQEKKRDRRSRFDKFGSTAKRSG